MYAVWLLSILQNYKQEMLCETELNRGAVLTLERKSWDKGDCWNAGQVLERSSGWLKVGVRTLLERC